MKKRLFSVIAVCFIILSMSLSGFAHSGRTDSSGGHKDNKNKSGLGSYHYHCGGYPPHLHAGGVCPYKSSSSNNGGIGNSNSSSSSSTKKSSSSSSTNIPKTVYATKINVANMPSSIKLGENVKLKGSVYPSNAKDKDISWESSDTTVATIDANGNLAAVGIGTAIISAKTSGGTTSKFNLTVEEISAESITIDNKVNEIIIGETSALSVTFIPADTTNKDIEWKSSDETIISIDQNGRFRALALGRTVITAIHKELTDNFMIEVKPILAKSIEINCINKETNEEYKELRFEKGTEIELEATIFPEDTTDTTVKWSVSDDNIATIDQEGKITMVNEGTVTVIAETSNGVTDKLDIEIYKISVVVNIIAIVIVALICVGLIGTPVFLIIWIVKKHKKK